MPLRMLLLSAVLLLATAARAEPPPPTDADAQTPVVIVGTSAIPAEVFRIKLAEQPAFMKTRLADPAKFREFVDNLVKFELLSQEARRRKLDARPEVQATINRVLVQALVQQFYEQQLDPTEADLQAYIKAHRSEFTKQESRRLALFYWESKPATEERGRAQAEAEDLLSKALRTQEIGKLPTLREQLSSMASRPGATFHEEHGQRFLTRDDIATLYSEPFADAVFGLSKSARASTLIETPTRLYLAVLVEVQPGVQTSLEDTAFRAMLSDRWRQEHRGSAFEAFYKELCASTPVHYDEAALEELRQSLTPPKPRDE